MLYLFTLNFNEELVDDNKISIALNFEEATLHGIACFSRGRYSVIFIVTP